MAEHSSATPPEGPEGDGALKGKDPPGEHQYDGENVRINSMFSIESVGPTDATNTNTDNRFPGTNTNTNTHNNFSGGDLMEMGGTDESASAITDTNASTSNTASSEIDAGREREQGEASLATTSTVPPTSIIQHNDDESALLINLDSLQVSERASDVSDLNGYIPKGGDNKTSWLSIDSSSTSQGSQGSYAHQVPNLLGSHGSNGNANEMNFNYQPNVEFGLPQQSADKPPMCQSPGQFHTAHSRASRFPNIDTPQNSNLDDILGPKGESIKNGYGLSIDGEPLQMQSDLDNMLGSPATHGRSSDLDETLGPYEGSTLEPPSTSVTASTATATSVTGGETDYKSEYTQFRESEKTTIEPRKNTIRSDPVQMDNALHNRKISGTSILPHNETVVYCTPANSSHGDPSTRTYNVTPSESRRAIENIGKVLNDRADSESYGWSPRERTILSEAYSDGNSASFHNTAARTRFGSEVTRKGTSFASISEHNKTHEQAPSRTSLPMNAVESESTWESKGIGISVSYTSASTNEDSSTRRGTLSPENQSATWESSRGGTFSPNSYTQKTDCTLSPGMSGSDVCSSYSSSRRGVMSTDYSGTRTFSAADSRTQTFSPADSRSRINQFSSTERDEFSPTDGTTGSGTQFSYDSRATSNVLSPTSALSPGDSRSQINQFSTAESSQLSSTEHGEFSPTDRTTVTNFSYDTRATPNMLSPTSASGIFSYEGDDDASKGGRMWQATEIVATKSKDRPLSPRAKKFADSIMARTRSRADPDALLNNASTVDTVEKPTRSMINVNAQEEGGIIQSTAIARKRGRVVQLLTIGLLSFLIAFLGGFLVLSSCHFFTVAVEVGDDGTEFDLHFGLWKYSPIDSAFQGHIYCNHYDGDFISGAPWFGRISSLVALAGGGFSLIVLWLYLVFGRCVQNLWNVAIFSAAVSGALQLCTLSVLIGPICSEEICTLGPAGLISIVAGCFYFVLAFEMHYNTPLVTLKDDIEHVSSREEPHHMVGNLEMTDFEYGAKAYVHRIAFGDANPYPVLNQVKKVNRLQHTGEATKEQDSGSYVPPSAIV